MSKWDNCHALRCIRHMQLGPMFLCINYHSVGLFGRYHTGFLHLSGTLLVPNSKKSYLAVASEQEQAEHPAVLVIVPKKKQIFTACVILKSTLRNPCWFYQVCAQLCCDFHCMIYANRPEHLWRYSSAVKLFPYRK